MPFGILPGDPQILGSLVLERQVFLGLAVARWPVEKRHRDLKMLAGVRQPSAGTITFDGWRVMLTDPATALDPGIATAFPDLAPGEILDLVTNIFLGRDLGRYENTRQRSAVCSIPSRWLSLDFDRVPTASEQ